ncbi:hypothetical protein G7Y79_00075g099060 [Physcia stellaris]|nr:hypothetical protein G7Y79_00075g099060 [Physcia stellaris]
MAPMLSTFMVRLDERVTGLDEAMAHLINTHSDPQKVATWRQQPIGDLIADFDATVARYRSQLVLKFQMLKPLQDNRWAHSLPPIHDHPLFNLSVKQGYQISQCIYALPWERLPSGRILRIVMEMLIEDRLLTRERVIVAFVLLESLLASVIEQNEAVQRGWWKSDGSWDDRKGNIREIRDTLARLPF